MAIKILGFVNIVVGSFCVLAININDIFKMAAYGAIEETTLAHCLKAAYALGMSWPMASALMLWIMPLAQVIMGLYGINMKTRPKTQSQRPTTIRHG